MRATNTEMLDPEYIGKFLVEKLQLKPSKAYTIEIEEE